MCKSYASVDDDGRDEVIVHPMVGLSLLAGSGEMKELLITTL
jgi:hypothetical protein